jgi:large subunit ribosomal protein L4
MTVKVYNQEGQEVGTTELSAGLFGINPNEAVVHQYVVNYLARQRQGNAATKTRKDVRGGGRKPWRQKGTGRARVGTTRSPLWRGGGIVFGPLPRSYGYMFPNNMKRLALQSVFSDKAQRDRIKVLDKIELSEIKTKSVLAMLTKLDLEGKKCLVLDEGRNESMVLSCRNLKNVRYTRANTTNGYDVLNADWVIFSKAGLEKAQEVLG